MSRPPPLDHHAVLGLGHSATEGEIRAAYRRLAKVHHPDRNPGDTQALETFRRITESYTALRDRRRAGGGKPDVSPLSADGAARRRASPRRGSATAAARLADLQVGGALWVDPSAVLVAPSRAAALRPDAGGSAFPTAKNVIRVERRGDGHHVFMPPQPVAHWALDDTAETHGMAVAALWVGERQDGVAGSPAAARVPLRLISGRVGEMRVGDRGWTSIGALARDGDAGWSIDLAEPVSPHPHIATRLRVLRDADGFRVHADVAASAWRPADQARNGDRAPVVAAILAGTQYPQPLPVS